MNMFACFVHEWCVLLECSFCLLWRWWIGSLFCLQVACLQGSRRFGRTRLSGKFLRKIGS